MDLKEIGEKHLPESLGKAKTEFVSISFLTNGSPKHSFLECILLLINNSQKQGLEVFWQMILSAAFRLVGVGHEHWTRCSWWKMLLQFFYSIAAVKNRASLCYCFGVWSPVFHVGISWKPILIPWSCLENNCYGLHSPKAFKFTQAEVFQVITTVEYLVMCIIIWLVLTVQ